MDYLFSNVTCVTMDERMRVLTDAFVGVEGGKISYLAQVPPKEQPGKIIEGTAWCSCPD